MTQGNSFLSSHPNPKILPSTYPFTVPSLLTSKDSPGFLSDQPKITTTSVIIKDTFMLSTVQPSLVPINIPSTVTLFAQSHLMRSHPGLFPSDVPPDITSLLPYHVTQTL